MHCTAAAADKNTNWAAMKAAGTNCFSSISTQPHDTINVPADFGPIYINGGNVDLKGTFNCTGCTIVLTNSRHGHERDHRYVGYKRAGQQQHYRSDDRHLTRASRSIKIAAPPGAPTRSTAGLVT